MQLTHTFTVPASVEQTWAAFNDIESVAGCFPGAVVTSVEGDTFQGSCKVKLGPIALVYNGSGTFIEKDESAHRMKIEAKGKDKRGNGTAGANVTATMTDEGGTTSVEVVTDLNITGKPAQFGRGVMQDVSDKLLGQFVDCLQTKVGDGGPATEAPATEAPTTEAPAAPAGGPVDPTVPAVAGEAPASATTEPGTTADAEPGTATAYTAHRAPAPQPAATPPPRPAAAKKPDNDALDLGTTVLPILAKTYWKQAVAAVVVIVIVIVLLVVLL